MAKPRLQIIAATPSAACLREILDIVSRKRGKGQLVVTAFSPSRLRAVREIVGEESEEIELLEFGALVGNVMALAGGVAGGLPGRGHVEAAVSLACETIEEESPFFRSSRTPGFQEQVARALDLLRGYGMESAELFALGEVAQNDLSSRLAGLAQVQKDSARMLEMLGKRFNAERIRHCMEMEGPIPFSGRIVVLAGSEDDPLNLLWLRWAAMQGADLTVVVEAHPTETGMFVGAKNVSDALGEEPNRLARVNLLTAQLFSPQPFPGTPSALDVSIEAMPDALGECEWTLRSALEAISEGIPPERIAIVVRRMEEYAPLLEAAAKRLGVPLSVTRTAPLLASGVARFLLDLLESLVQRTTTPLGVLVRKSYFGLTPDELNEMSAGFSRSRSAPSDPWGVLAGFADEVEPTFPWLRQLLKWRREGLAESRSLAAWSDRLKDLGELPWLANVFEGAEPTHVRDRYAMNVLQRCLAEMAALERVHGSKDVPLSGFVRRCRQRWEIEEVATPRSPEGVAVVGSATEIGLADTVFVLGLLEGVFPRRRSENAILSDDDLAWISEQRGVTLPNSHRRAKEERDEFFRVCSAPMRKLVLSYPQTGEDRDNVKAFYLQEVERIMGVPVRIHPRTQLVPSLAIAESDRKLQEATASPTDEPLANALKTEAAQEVIRRKTGEKYRSTDLRRVLSCPYQYMATSRLQIRANRPQSRWNRLLNLPQEVSLPAAPNALVAIQNMNQRLDAIIEDLQGDALPEDLNIMRLGARRLIREWVQREFEAREVWKREAAEPNPEYDQPLRSTFKTRDGNVVELTGRFPGLSHYGSHRVINVFLGHDPIADFNAPRFVEQLSDSDRFELGLTLASIPNPKEGVGLEVDAKGQRRLILSPRPMPPPSSKFGYSVSTVDEEERREWILYVEERMREAIAKLSLPAVEATPGDDCKFCDMGELCRRSSTFSEVGDPFAEDET